MIADGTADLTLAIRLRWDRRSHARIYDKIYKTQWLPYSQDGTVEDETERVHLRNTHTRLRSANEGNTDMGVP